MRRLLVFCLLNLPFLSVADSREKAVLPEPPELPRKVQSGKVLAPDPAAANAAQGSADTLNPDAPEPPLPIQSGETLEPDITITRANKKTIQEYRRNGELYMVKVIPDVGPAYYLIDVNGDGKLDVRGSDLDKGLDINKWKLFEWN